MKKYILLGIFAIIAAGTIVASCKKEKSAAEKICDCALNASTYEAADACGEGYSEADLEAAYARCGEDVDKKFGSN
jgi:hypothetical protein